MGSRDRADYYSRRWWVVGGENREGVHHVHHGEEGAWKGVHGVGNGWRVKGYAGAWCDWSVLWDCSVWWGTIRGFNKTLSMGSMELRILTISWSGMLLYSGLKILLGMAVGVDFHRARCWDREATEDWWIDMGRASKLMEYWHGSSVCLLGWVAVCCGIQIAVHLAQQKSSGNQSRDFVFQITGQALQYSFLFFLLWDIVN